MADHMQVWKAKVAPENVERLTAVRPEAIAEAKRLCPELLRADLVRVGEIDTTMEETEYRLLCEEVRVSCTYGMLLCIPRPQRAAYLLADVLGVTDVEGAEILGCSREAFRQRVSRARRTLRYVIDNRCGLVDAANPCKCGRQVASSEEAGILDRGNLVYGSHPRQEVRAWIEPAAKELDDVVAIGDLYRFDRFAAPAALWDDLQRRYPALLGAG